MPPGTATSRLRPTSTRFQRLHLLIAVSVIACMLPRVVSQPTPPFEEVHEVVSLEGVRIGTQHRVVAVDGAAGTVRSTSSLELTLDRYKAQVRIRRDESTVESERGEVLEVSMRQGSPGGKQLVLTGKRAGDRLHVVVDSGRIERRIPWPEGVLGPREQERLIWQRKPAPGDRFTFKRYEPTYNTVLTIRAEARESEMVDLLGTRTRLLRLELKPDRLEAPGQTIRPPMTVWWLDGECRPVRRQMEVDGLGTLILTRTTKDRAMAALPRSGARVDIGTRSLIPLDRTLVRPYDTRSVLYRVTLIGEDTSTTPLVSDEHQEVRNVQGRTFELLVRPARPHQGGKTAAPVADFLSPSYYIDHEDETICQLAERATKHETGAWKKAVRIERLVKNSIQTDNSAALVPASEVARRRRGDCRHHAFLTTAVCRAAGLPARTAIGMLYVTRGGPKLGFHMWTEVWVEGNWVGLDSTLGRGGVSGAHVKITDHSWHGTASMTPLLPVTGVIGKLRVQISSSE